MGIYVEQRIDAPLEAIWTHTQDPALHERWDLRFTEIRYLPRPEPGAPQRFRYSTRLGLGVSVVGEGETVGQRDLADGSRTSALRFWSDQARSLIHEGRGYWKYVPTSDGVRFLTAYDYDTRYGLLGRAFDRAVFQPLMGWATAWSFDRLRLWLEQGVDPGHAARVALTHGVARVGLAAIFAYHGLVPKLLGPDSGEVALMDAAGVPGPLIGPAIAALGVAEIVFALILVLTWHRAWPAYVVFNPVTLNLALAALALIDRLTLDGIPSAGRCLRRPTAPAGAAMAVA